ncbi:HCL140Cp [Eremothecium sinecaudum]|uniref:RING-type E3 ubiquitin transferase n=1 Tax=Eremothecium sinecaudum TaxID=45286 RepID=A0A120K205_9SACH|nr:HCL140Cp [Eremothecium sinecaudum]AMD20011.1 HCL140Cp [Eremothecium sinecaudum]
MDQTEQSEHVRPTCRICRMESSEDNELFHPCQCKGSIKYVHEQCLFEWIGSKNIDVSRPGTTVKCDICHFPFQLKTIYDENMPKGIPILPAITRYLSWVYVSAKTVLFITTLVIVFGFGLPMVWNMWGKFYSLMLHNFDVPYPDQPWTFNFIYGFYTNMKDVEGWNRWPTLLYQLGLNYRFSLLQIIMVVTLHLALYFLYDMIAREEIFSQMVLHKIGPRCSELERLRKRIRDRFPAINEEVVQKIEALMELPKRQAAFQEQRLARETGAEGNNPIEYGQDELPEEGTSIQAVELEELNITGNGQLPNLEDRDSDELDDALDRDNGVAGELRYREALRELEGLLNNELPREGGGIGEQGENFGNAPIVERVNVNLNGRDQRDDPAFHLLNIRLNMGNLFIYFFITAVFIGAYLFLSYFIPTIVGWSLLFVYINICKFALAIFTTSAKFVTSRLPFSLLEHAQHPKIQLMVSAVQRTFDSKFLFYYKGYIEDTMWAKSSIIMCGLPAAVTYITGGALICLSTEVLCKGYGRKSGMTDERKRNLFQLLFAVRCTIKIFILFTFELAGFPILAGLMINYSLLISFTTSKDHYFWKFFILDAWLPGMLMLYWAIGTVYMYWFAIFIGTIRQHIIRPGVLFFIRSPDDPNIKILHDSLLHPMRIQLSRLIMSVVIYAIFILCGFGFHTRLLFPFLLKHNLIPVYNTLMDKVSFFTIALAGIAGTNLESSQKLRSYIRAYWLKVFTICCRRLRLSSFIMGKSIPMERGYIVYRNAFYRYLAPTRAQWSNPELFSKPKTLNEAQELFKTLPSIHAYFIPDGCLLRVPANDIVSRSYVQMLFVPVTKDDKLLKPLDLKRIRERSQQNSGEFGYLDKQITDFDSYTVVYVPPLFKLRYTLLLVMIWVFASILFIGIGLTANFVGHLLVWPYSQVVWKTQTSGLDLTYTYDLLDDGLNPTCICVALIAACIAIDSGVVDYIYHKIMEIPRRRTRIVNEEEKENTGEEEEGEHAMEEFGQEIQEHREEDHIIEQLPVRNNVSFITLMRRFGNFVRQMVNNLTQMLLTSMIATFFLNKLHIYMFRLITRAISYNYIMSVGLFWDYYIHNRISCFTDFNSLYADFPSFQVSNLFYVDLHLSSFTVKILPRLPLPNYAVLLGLIGIEGLASIIGAGYYAFFSNIEMKKKHLYFIIVGYFRRYFFPTFITIVLQYIVIELEYQSNPSAYMSRHALYDYMVTKMSSETLPREWTFLQHLFYWISPIVLGCYYTYLVYSISKKSLANFSQWLIDDIYGKGRTLVNLEEDS